ncbi:hypothetical protein Droror1_Dr00012783 [Drosera rotundifolia]
MDEIQPAQPDFESPRPNPTTKHHGPTTRGDPITQTHQAINHQVNSIFQPDPHKVPEKPLEASNIDSPPQNLLKNILSYCEPRFHQEKPISFFFVSLFTIIPANREIKSGEIFEGGSDWVREIEVVGVGLLVGVAISKASFATAGAR